MTTDLATAFLDAHRPGNPLLLPNAWDVGSAKLFQSLGFEAIATTSGGFAATLGRRDGSVSGDEALSHAAELAAAVTVPINADLEDGFGATIADVEATYRRASEGGIAGASIEDAAGGAQRAVLPAEAAAERVAAAVAGATSGPNRVIITGRAENYLYGVTDLADTIARLQAYEQAGADVLYAPGLVAISDIRQLVAEVTAPVNVLLLPGGPTVPELADAGVARVSVGGAFHLVALGAVTAAAEELRGDGPYTFWATAGAGRSARDASFT
jgi:2-methylisocitrate lyase-like PEP mutase family enzyme